VMKMMNYNDDDDDDDDCSIKFISEK